MSTVEGIEKQGEQRRSRAFASARWGGSMFASFLCTLNCLAEVHPCISSRMDPAVYSAGGEVPTLSLFFLGQETSEMERYPLALLAEALAPPALTAYPGRELGN